VLNYNHVYYFHVAATEGSVARAADVLEVTQPTVSEQIRQLERTLGVPLFERTTTGLRLTDAGRRAYEQTTTMFRAAQRLLEALGKGPIPTVCVLRIGITAAVSRTVATAFLMPVFRLDPCIPVIHTGELTEQIRSLRGRELDLVLAETEPGGPAARGLTSVALHRLRLVAIAPPDLEVPASWDGAPLIQYRETSAYRFEVDDYLEANQLKPRIVGEADDALLMLEAAARGAGIAFVPRSLARDAIAAGRVKQVAALEVGATTMYAIHGEAEAGDLARRAVDQLIAHAAELEARA